MAHRQEQYDAYYPEEGESTPLLKRFQDELKEQSRTSIPVMVSMVFLRIPLWITLHMVGNIPSNSDDGNADELAASGLAQSLANITGLSIAAGLSAALTTLAGQAHGIVKKYPVTNLSDDDVDTPLLLNSGDGSVNYNQDGEVPQLLLSSSDGGEEGNPQCALPSFSRSATTYFMRGVFVQFVFAIPIGLYWMIGVKPLLVALGQDGNVASLVEEYLRILAPGMWGYSLNFTICTFFQVIGLADIQTCVTMIAAALHWPLTYLFIYGLDCGFKGAAVATTVSQLISPSLMICYVLGTESGRARLPLSTKYDGTTKEMIQYAIYSSSGIRQYLGLALSGLLVVSEWWASETAIFLSGTLKPDSSLALDGMVIYHTTLGSCYLINLGLSAGASARVGNLLGAGKSNEAAFASSVAICTTAILSVMMGAMFWFTPHTLFPSFYDPDESVQMSAARTISWLSIYVIADGIQTTLYGVIKGCGRQLIVVPIVIASYWCIALPLAYYFAFVKHDGTTDCDDFDNEFTTCGVAGLSAGMTVGTYIHCIIIAVVVSCFTDWEKEAGKAERRFISSCGASKDLIISNEEDVRYFEKIACLDGNSVPSCLTDSSSFTSEERCLSSSEINYGSI